MATHTTSERPLAAAARRDGHTVAIVVLAGLAPSLGEVAFLFGPADYCALMLLGFVVYFLYGKNNSKLQQGIVVMPTEVESEAFIKPDPANR